MPLTSEPENVVAQSNKNEVSEGEHKDDYAPEHMTTEKQYSPEPPEQRLTDELVIENLLTHSNKNEKSEGLPAEDKLLIASSDIHSIENEIPEDDHNHITAAPHSEHSHYNEEEASEPKALIIPPKNDQKIEPDHKHIFFSNADILLLANLLKSHLQVSFYISYYVSEVGKVGSFFSRIVFYS